MKLICKCHQGILCDQADRIIPEVDPAEVVCELCRETPISLDPERPAPQRPRGKVEVSTPEVSILEVSTPEVSTPEVSTPEVSTPEVSTPEVSTPEVSTPEVSILEVGLLAAHPRPQPHQMQPQGFCKVHH